MRRIYFFIICFSFLIANLSSVLAEDKLPKIVKKATQNTKIPADSIGFNVIPVGKNANPNFQFGWHASNPMNPASTMKVLTTAAGLDILGPQYKWKTNIYTNGTLIDETLNGDLIFQGFGDPKLVPEQMSQIVTALRKLGIKNIIVNIQDKTKNIYNCTDVNAFHLYLKEIKDEILLESPNNIHFNYDYDIFLANTQLVFNYLLWCCSI